MTSEYPHLLIGIFPILLFLLCFWFSTFSIGAIVGGVLSANLLEYSLHRWPLHQKPKWVPISYKDHTGVHHRFYTDDNMYFEQRKDILHIVTSPLNVFVIIILAGMISIVPSLIFGCGIGLLWFGTMLCYYVVYETLHFSAHAPPSHWMRRIKILDGVYNHHLTHHKTNKMRHGNFNVVFPLFDHIFGTVIPKE